VGWREKGSRRYLHPKGGFVERVRGRFWLFRGRLDFERRFRCLGLLPFAVLFLDGEQFSTAPALYGGEGRHEVMRVRGTFLHNMTLLRFLVKRKWLRALLNLCEC
jgi:hypothetical protein